VPNTAAAQVVGTFLLSFQASHVGVTSTVSMPGMMHDVVLPVSVQARVSFHLQK
jgi:hypothetical protein